MQEDGLGLQLRLGLSSSVAPLVRGQCISDRSVQGSESLRSETPPSWAATCTFCLDKGLTVPLHASASD